MQLKQYFHKLIYICDFHREQTWKRWVKHGLPDIDQDALLSNLRAWAWARSATADESTSKDNHF